MTSQTRRLLKADFTEPQAQAIADTIDDAIRDFVTRDELHRALWLQGLAITAANAAMLSAAVVVIKLA